MLLYGKVQFNGACCLRVEQTVGLRPEMRNKILTAACVLSSRREQNKIPNVDRLTIQLFDL